MGRAPGKTVQVKKAQDAFLAAYSLRGTVLHACEDAGVGRQTHYDWIAKDDAYAARFEDAKREVVERMEREAIRRASEGLDEPVYQGGNLVGHVRKFSDTLLIFLLKAHEPEKYRETVRNEHTGRDGEPIRVVSEGKLS